MLTEDIEAIAHMPKSPQGSSRSSLARVKHLFDCGDFAACIAASDAMLALDSQHLGALEVRVRAEWRLGDFPAVLRTLQKLTLLNPYEPGYYLMRGDAFRLLGRPVEAKAAYERCARFEDSQARFEALLNIEEIDAQSIAKGNPASVDLDLDSSWLHVDHVDDGPSWVNAVRPS